MSFNSKLIITVTTAKSWMYPEVHNAPEKPEEIAQTVYECYEAGASVAHIHSSLVVSTKDWAETIKRIRDKCDIIVQVGMSSIPLKERMEIFRLKPDMISVMLSHHDEAFLLEDVHRLHPRQELEDYAKLCRDYGVKPEFEVWHTGSIWNLNYLIQKGLLEKPYFLTLFFGWPGGNWSPPTPQELAYRAQNLPPDHIYQISVMGPTQTSIATLSIILGGHVRVGTEDYPYLYEGVPAKNNAQLVARIARISKELGRDVADPGETRKLMNLKKRK